MNELMIFAGKEWRHVLRDPVTLLIVLLLPVCALFIFGYALTNELNEVPVTVVDLGNNQLDAELLLKVNDSPYFETKYFPYDLRTMEDLFLNGELKGAIVLPPDFETKLYKNARPQALIVTDGCDPNAARQISAYLERLLLEYSNSLVPIGFSSLNIQNQMLYNPGLKSQFTFIPGVMAVVFMIICSVITAMAIVREKEKGTLHMMVIAGAKPVYIYYGKALVYVVIALVMFIMIQAISVMVIGLPFRGSVWLGFLMGILFIAASLSCGLMLASLTSSQNTILFLTLFVMITPTMLCTGFIVPVENMPIVLRWFCLLIPSRWFYIGMQRVMFQGQGLTGIWFQVMVLVAMTGAFTGFTLYKLKNSLK